MALKGWFGGSGQKAQQEYTIDDLIVLERYEEAEAKLLAKLKTQDDLHARLKLAEVYTQLKRYDKAADEFSYVAEEYASDGFYDKGIALLAKAMKLAPLDQSLRLKVDKFQREKSMEQVRALALEGLRQAGGQSAGTSALELQRLWHNLANSTLVQHLPGEQVKRLFSAMQLVHLEAKTVVAEEGSGESFLLLIVRGVLEAFVLLGGRETTLRSFTSGDMVGEAALLERSAWPANYRVAEPATVLRLTREGLEQTLVGNPDPRSFLEALREQHNDRDVAAALRRLRASA
jgi:cyclic nucleotide-binding protein